VAKKARSAGLAACGSIDGEKGVTAMPDDATADPRQTIAELRRKLDGCAAELVQRTAERDAALAREAATAEVLQVINRSSGDLAPVFDAMLEKAMGLGEAAFGMMHTYDGERFNVAAMRGVPEAYTEYRKHNPPVIGPGTGPARILAGESVVHIVDLETEDAYREGESHDRAVVDLAGARSILSVALRREDALLGMLTIFRQEVRPFSDRQVALLQNFAAQAVIAMENARLLTETREALEQQTATAEVLQVINSSPGDLTPVFDAILEKAHALCGATFGSLLTFDGQQFRALAVRGLRSAVVDILREGFRPSTAHPMSRLFDGDRFVQIPDLAQVQDAGARAGFELGGMRSLLAVPLRKDDALLGTIVATRPEVRPFSEKEIALLENFAAQAVIAMENARLLTETREALEQQTATAEVLGVINSSPGDLAPVFNAMLEKAVRLCEAAHGYLYTYDGERFVPVAEYGDAAHADWLRQRGPVAGLGTSPHGRISRGERFVHIPDVWEYDAYRDQVGGFRQSCDSAGTRTFLAVSLRKDEALLGVIHVYRREVRPFSEKQIGLLQNFAAQAVIAMENARLITETREALEQQTATAEVLQVINSSPGDLAPVFEAILEKAHSLCGASLGSMMLYDGEYLRAVATRGLPERFAERMRDGFPAPDSPASGPLLAGERFVHISDLALVDHPVARAAAELAGTHTLLSVPLRKGDALLGMIVAGRPEIQPYTDKQIALLENFAAQAVIAMENARLITETREALEQQTATAEVLGVINSSPGDLQPVFDAMLERAIRLCDADLGAFFRFDGEAFHLVAESGTPPAAMEALREPLRLGAGPVLERLVNGEDFVQVADVADSAAYRTGQRGRRILVDLFGARTAVWIALRRDEALFGFFCIYRREVRPFTDKQIALLQNFAAQAVIAMENARLLDEIRQRQQELRATFDNMVDGVAMFDEALHLAAWNKNFQELLDLPEDYLAKRHNFDEYIRYLTERGEFGDTTAEAEIARLRARLGDHYSFERVRPDGRVIEVRHNPMPDGGIVLIYTDITERKRSEAEIRAARDAAEAAYRDLQSAQASLVQAQKMAALGQLTAGIAHEIKNPLNFVNNFASLSTELLGELKEEVTPALAAFDYSERAAIDETIEMLSGNLGKIVEHGQRADNIVKSMLEHSRGVSGERREVDLNNLIEEALSLAYHGARAQDGSFNITLERDYASGLAPIELAPQEMTRVFLNLIGNSFYAADKRAKAGAGDGYRPTLSVSTLEADHSIEVRVRDNGGGIPADVRDKLFQPFFTTKPTGEGTGLGLSISYDIVTQQHGGSIEVASEEGAYTEFTIRLPRR
jgi:PAS domain S-box-containing protein